MHTFPQDEVIWNFVGVDDNLVAMDAYFMDPPVIHVSKDDGLTWTINPVESPDSPMLHSCIATTTNTDSIFALGGKIEEVEGSNNFFISKDLGLNWTLVEQDPIFKLPKL